MIPNRTCEPWKCPTFENIVFEDIVIDGAQRAGDINGFENDLLQGLTFRNVTFKTLPKTGWSCGYVNTSNFKAVHVVPNLTCTSN